MNLFVTGTDTDVGKTFVTALLTQALRRAGLDTVALKPVCCGPRDDVETLRAASDHELDVNATNPVWLASPTAPFVAAEAENREIDFDELSEWFRLRRAGRRSVLVEGAGGWLVPIAGRRTVADLAAAFGLDVLVVVANRLGCINHTLLTVEAIRARGLTCAGLVLNTLPGESSPASQTNRALLARCCDVPILFDVAPHQTTLDLAVT